MQLASLRLNMKEALDKELFQHIVYVSNRILMLSKQDGISSDSLTIMGKYLWRLYNVIAAYNAKRQEATLSSIISIVKDFEGVFSGT